MFLKGSNIEREKFITDIAVFYVGNKKATMRSTAKVFSVSKSFISKAINDELMYIDAELYDSAKDKIKFNIRERAERGGKASRIKNKGKRKC